MEPTRRDFIQAGVALAGAAGLGLTETAANAAEPQPTIAAAGESLAGHVTDKVQDLATATTMDKTPLTTNLGQPISTDQNSLRAGGRGPALLEDFVLREKLQHFDHERIPERIVHARGAAAHGHFQVYQSLADLTAAKVLHDPAVKTPVYVRFSTVAGSRGSADTARDVPDIDDRHVLAAAIASQVPIIVTFNLSDFPDTGLSPYGVRALHPDVFLLELLEAMPEAFVAATRTHRMSLKNPPRNPDEYLAQLVENGLHNTAARLQPFQDQI
jgi:hypothetical protein